MNLTHKAEHLPTSTPITGPGRAAAAAAAAQELAEVRQLLSRPSELLQSPRVRRRHQEAIAWAALYTDEQDTAA